MSESRFKNNNAYFVKEGIVIIIIGLVICFLTRNQNFDISGTTLLTISIVFFILNGIISILRGYHSEKYAEENNILEISKIIYWDEKDYNCDYCKKARKISRSELKNCPQYYPYFWELLLNRRDYDRKFINGYIYTLLGLSVYAIFQSKIILLAELVLYGINVYRVNPKRWNRNNIEWLRKNGFTVEWRKRENRTHFCFALFFFFAFCLLSIILLNCQIDTSADTALISFLDSIVQDIKKIKAISFLCIVPFLYGLYNICMAHLSEPPDSSRYKMTGIMITVISETAFFFINFLI